MTADIGHFCVRLYFGPYRLRWPLCAPGHAGEMKRIGARLRWAYQWLTNFLGKGDAVAWHEWQGEPPVRMTMMRLSSPTPLRYHLLDWRMRLRHLALTAAWKLRRPMLLLDNRIWWAMALREPGAAGGRVWPAGSLITRDDQVIVSHRRKRMERMASDLGWRLVRLSGLPRDYILWEDWGSPGMR